MGRTVILTCDICGASGDVTKYRIGKGRVLRTVDLCQKHAKPMDEALKAAAGVAANTLAPTKLTTMEEVEEMKRRARQGQRRP